MTVNDSVVLKEGGKRYFIQPDGPAPSSDVHYSGVGAQFMTVGSPTIPVSGGNTRRNVQDPHRRSAFIPVAVEKSAPDLVSVPLQFMNHAGRLPRHFYNLGDCPFNIYETVGNCADPSDLMNGFDSYLRVFARLEAIDKSPAGGSFNGDAGLEDGMNTTSPEVYTISKMTFGAKAAVQVYSSVIDVVYGSDAQCAGCGPKSDGTKAMYAVTNNEIGSTGEPPSVTYSVDGGANWTTMAAITGAVSTDVPVAIDIVGAYLIVCFKDAGTGGYYVSEIDAITGIPSSTWTKVTTGFSGTDSPNDMIVKSPSEIWFVGDGGAIYKSTSVLNGVTSQDSPTSQDLNRIAFQGDVILIGANDGTIVFSDNNGVTFSVAANGAGAAVTAVEVINPYLWFAATNSGPLWTSTQGRTAWVSIVLPGATEAITNYRDLVFVNNEIGYVAGNGATSGFLWTTFDGGRNWAVSSSLNSRLGSIPTMDYVNRIAYPVVTNAAVAANNLLLGG